MGGKSNTNPYGQQKTAAQWILPIVGGLFGPGGSQAGLGIANFMAEGDVAGAPAGTEASAQTNLGGLFQGQGLSGFWNNFLEPQLLGGPGAGPYGGSVGGLQGGLGGFTGQGNYPERPNMGGSVGGKGGGKGGKGGGGGSTGTLDQLGSQYNQMLGNQANIGNELMNVSQTPMQGGQSQYLAGLSGQLTPAQQALTNFTEAQNMLNTNSIYGNLGLGNSTMRTQDMNANALQSLAQQEAIDFQNEQYGLNAMGAGANMMGEAGNLYGQAGQGYLNQAQMLNQAKAGKGQGGKGGKGGGTNTGGLTNALAPYVTQWLGGGTTSPASSIASTGGFSALTNPSAWSSVGGGTTSIPTITDLGGSLGGSTISDFGGTAATDAISAIA